LISKPLRNRQNPESLPFNWGEFREQNAIARRLVTENEYVLMDVDTMTALRGTGTRGGERTTSRIVYTTALPGPSTSGRSTCTIL